MGGAGGSGGGEADSGAGGSAADSLTSTGDPELDACRHFARALQFCFGPDDPFDAARLDARALATCKPQFAQPGITYTAEDLEACARAIDLFPCEAGGLPECDFRGSLPAEAPCIFRAQCQSGVCMGSGDVPPGIVDLRGLDTSPETCGKCAPAVAAIGDDCRNGECPKGSVCAAGQVFGSGDFTCVPIVPGDVGTHCNGLWASCKLGLYCDSDQNCRALAQLGEPCDNSQVIFCAPPLTCTGKTCRKRTGEGSTCENSDGCMSGFVCYDGHVCRRITWAEPGMRCDDVFTQCRTGYCSNGTCVHVLPDGSPCRWGDPCDTGSECFSASIVTGADADAGGVGAPRSAVVCR